MNPAAADPRMAGAKRLDMTTTSRQPALMTKPGSSAERREHELRLTVMNLGADASRELTEFWHLAEPEMPELVDAFHHYLTSFSPVGPLPEADSDGLKQALADHWRRLFCDGFTDCYFESARALGALFETIGIEPRLYEGGYNFIHGRLISLALRQLDWSRDKLQSVITAITSAIALDKDLAGTVYFAAAVELERLRQQASAAETARREISRLLAGLPAAIYSGLVETDGTVRRFEIAGNTERLSGWDGVELASWGAWRQRVRGVDDKIWRAHFDRVNKEGGGAIEYDFRHKDGSVLRFRDQLRVVERLDDGRFEVIGYISDVTRDHVTRAKAVSSAKLATLGEMASGLAHEINQPFTIMSLAAENSVKMLQERGSEGIGYTIDRLHRIRDQAARARTIIDHLRIFGAQSPETQAPVRLSEAVEGALSLVSGTLRSTNVVVVNEIDDSLPPVIGGLALIEQVLVNVVLNARDAMAANPEGTTRYLVLSSATKDTADAVSLEIRDSGPGIPASVQDRIFEPFFTTKELGKGIGLGLSICHGIMTSLGGNITAENVPGSGAVFTLTFRKASV
jgi:signal transduction histidine kinase